MKKTLAFTVTVLVIVIACLAVAVVKYEHQKNKRQQESVIEAVNYNYIIKQHDADNAAKLNQAQAATSAANGKLQAACNVLKTTKVYNPALCQ